MNGKGSFIILLIVIVVLSLALAVTVFLLFFTSSTPKDETTEKVVIEETKEPKDKDLIEIELLEKKPFNLKNIPGVDKVSFIQVSCVLKYFVKVEGLEPAKKIESGKKEISAIIGNYFLGLTAPEALNNEAKEKASTELVKKVNEMLLENEDMSEKQKARKPIVYKIIFYDWLVQ